MDEGQATISYLKKQLAEHEAAGTPSEDLAVLKNALQELYDTAEAARKTGLPTEDDIDEFPQIPLSP